MLRAVAISLVALAAGCASRPAVSPPPEAGGQSEFRPLVPGTWPISKDRAIEIACEAMGERREDLLPSALHAIGGIDGERPVWEVDYSHPLGPAWAVTVDGRTGEVVRKRRLPSV